VLPHTFKNIIYQCNQPLQVIFSLMLQALAFSEMWKARLLAAGQYSITSWFLGHCYVYKPSYFCRAV